MAAVVCNDKDENELKKTNLIYFVAEEKSIKKKLILALKLFSPPKQKDKFIFKKDDVLLDYFGIKLGKNVTIEPGVVCSRGVRLEDNVKIGSGSVLGAYSTIGKDTLIEPRVVIGDYNRIGQRCKLHPGVVLGADGFGFEYDPQVLKSILASQNQEAKGMAFQSITTKVPQIGRVILDDDIEIGANSTIDKATISATWIQRGVKIDNLVHIAHNVVVCENTLLAAQSGIAGSSVIGRAVVLSGQVGIGDHVILPDGVQLGGQSGIRSARKIKRGQKLLGTPAIDLFQHLRWETIRDKLLSQGRDFFKKS